jgi:hypothetical protein
VPRAPGRRRPERASYLAGFDRLSQERNRPREPHRLLIVTVLGLPCSDGEGAVMDERVHSGTSGYKNPTDYEWRWWHGVLGLAIIFAIISLTYL